MSALSEVNPNVAAVFDLGLKRREYQKQECDLAVSATNDVPTSGST